MNYLMNIVVQKLRLDIASYLHTNDTSNNLCDPSPLFFNT